MGKGFGFDISRVMKQAQKMQADVRRVQEELAVATVEATSGGGMVKVVATGAQEIRSIEIKPEAVDPDDVEMLQDLVLAGVNEALRKSKDLAAGEMAKVTGGIGMPGLI